MSQTTTTAFVIDSEQSDRPSWTETFMDLADVMAKRSVIETQVGAVLVQDRRVVSTGYNGRPTGAFDNHRVGKYQLDEVHAEINAIAFAARFGISTEGATIYVTVAPCVHCAKAIIQAGIKHVVCYDRKARDQEACPDGEWLLKRHDVGVTHVVREDA